MTIQSSMLLAENQLAFAHLIPLRTIQQKEKKPASYNKSAVNFQNLLDRSNKAAKSVAFFPNKRKSEAHFAADRRTVKGKIHHKSGEVIKNSSYGSIKKGHPSVIRGDQQSATNYGKPSKQYHETSYSAMLCWFLEV